MESEVKSGQIPLDYGDLNDQTATDTASSPIVPPSQMPAPPKKRAGTTIWVDDESSERVTRYCQRIGIDKKNFVRLAIEWIDSGNIDLKSETKYWPVHEANKKDKQEVPAIRTQVEAAITSLESLPDLVSARIIDTLNASNKAIAESSKESNDAMLEALRQQGASISSMKDEFRHYKEAEELRNSLKMAVAELRRCESLFTRANPEVIKQLEQLL